jgi:hypothetical protein
MIRIRKWNPQNAALKFSVHCDSKGLTGNWKCENVGPFSDNRNDAGDFAIAAGWIIFRHKWYCPQCQSDGFIPGHLARPPLAEQAKS